MSPIARLAVATVATVTVALSVGAGCQPSFDDDASRLEGARILAVRADPPEVRPGEAWRVLRFSLDEAHAPLVVDKGSIAVDGVSLTVSAASPAAPADGIHWFEVSLIPETLEATTLGHRVVGDRVNLETDILARHVQRLHAFASAAPAAPAVPEYPAATAAPTEGGSK